MIRKVFGCICFLGALFNFGFWFSQSFDTSIEAGLIVMALIGITAGLFAVGIMLFGYKDDNDI